MRLWLAFAESERLVTLFLQAIFPQIAEQCFFVMAVALRAFLLIGPRVLPCVLHDALQVIGLLYFLEI